MFNIKKKDFQNFLYSKKINNVLKKIINIFIPIRKYRHALRNKLQNKYYNHKIKVIVKDIYYDCYVIFSRNGVGDVFFAASLIKEFKKTHPGKVVYLTEKKTIANFLKSFKSIDEVVYDSELESFQQRAIVQRKIKKGQLNFLYFPYRGNKPNYVFCDSYANLLGVELNSERELPQISEEDIKQANLEFEKLQIKPSKTIILIPENVMWDYRVIKPKVWKKLAQKLQDLGYDVVFNSNNKEYKKFKNTFIPINHLCQNEKI